MRRLTKQSFVLACGLHLLLVLAMVVFGIIATWQDEPEPVVFELVQAASAAPAQPVDQPEESVEETNEPIRTTPMDPLREVPEVPDIPEPQPEPEPKPTPQPEPAPEPRPRMSYDDWARDRDLPERVQRVQQPRRSVRPNIPELSTDFRERVNDAMSPITIEGVDVGTTDESELQRYLTALRVRIEQVFQPSGSGLAAETTFVVTASGQIQNPRISNSSGDQAFDRGVLNALSRVRTPGPPPGNRPYTFSITFRSE